MKAEYNISYRVLSIQTYPWDGVRYTYNQYILIEKIGKYGIKLANSRKGCGINR